ncbi:MAG: M23 family metallopeptidase [Thermomicrobiales bacterium]
MLRWRLLIVVACLSLLTIPLHDAAGQATPAPGLVAPTPVAPAQTTALFVRAVHDPLWTIGSDGMAHVAYDLILTNVFSSPVTLTGLEVLTPEGSALLVLAGEDLRAVTTPIFGGAPTAEIPASGALAVTLDLVVPPDAVPSHLTQRFTYALPPNAPDRALLSATTFTTADVLVNPDAPLVIAPPLRGSGWLARNACCAPGPHRTARLTNEGTNIVNVELFAIDWVQLEDGRAFASDGARNADHHAYGAEALAVGDGVVAWVRDGAADNAPGVTPVATAPADLGGNQIMIALDSGAYAFYAHLQPGSLRVKPGDRVLASEVLALIGNSGASDAPHLHFQLSEGPDPLTSVSLPFVIDAWTLEGAAQSDGTQRGETGPQDATSPLSGDIAAFPPRDAATPAPS